MRASRKGDRVTLTWGIPTQTTDRQTIRSVGPTRICRGLEPTLTDCKNPIGEAPGTYVYVVNPDQTVNVRKVTLGPGDSLNIVVTSGLKPGEMVVTDGADKLKDGGKVLVRQAGAAPGAAAPTTNQGPGNQGQGQHRRRQAGQNGSGAQGGQPQSQ